MTDIRALLQATLDTALYSLGVNSYWGERADITASEYVVYSISGDSGSFFANDTPVGRSVYCIVSYYYSAKLAGTAAGRTTIKSREDLIRSSLQAADFAVTSFDDTDPTDAAYRRIVFEAEFGEVI
jgi:hypothetical protein